MQILLALPAMLPLCLGSMGATLVLEENAIVSPEISPLSRCPPQLQAYRFKSGENARAGPGRPKGMKNAQTSILEAAPFLAKQYIKRAAKSDAICIDARKWIMPTDEDSTASADRVVIFLGGGELPRILPSVPNPTSSLEALP